MVWKRRGRLPREANLAGSAMVTSFGKAEIMNGKRLRKTFVVCAGWVLRKTLVVCAGCVLLIIGCFISGRHVARAGIGTGVPPCNNCTCRILSCWGLYGTTNSHWGVWVTGTLQPSTYAVASVQVAANCSGTKSPTQTGTNVDKYQVTSTIVCGPPPNGSLEEEAFSTIVPGTITTQAQTTCPQ